MVHFEKYLVNGWCRYFIGIALGQSNQTSRHSRPTATGAIWHDDIGKKTLVGNRNYAINYVPAHIE